MGKCPPPRSGDSGDRAESKWPYFKSLMFLLGIVKPRTSASNLKSNNNSEHQDENVELVSHNENSETGPMKGIQEIESQAFDIQLGSQQTQPDGSQQIQPTRTNSPSSENFLRKRKRPDGNAKYNQQILSIEEKKASLLERVINERGCTTDNDDELFFRSLLPHVSKIPQHLKLRFRNRVQMLVDEFAYELNNPIQSSHLNSQPRQSIQQFNTQFLPYTGSTHTDSTNSSDSHAPPAQPSILYEDLRSPSNANIW